MVCPHIATTMLYKVVFNAEMPVTMRLGDDYEHPTRPLLPIGLTRVEIESGRYISTWDIRNLPHVLYTNEVIMKGDKVNVSVYFHHSDTVFMDDDPRAMLDIILHVCGTPDKPQFCFGS